MQGQINPKIVGATIIGFALVAGAYTISSMREDKTIQQPAAVVASAPERVAIAVTDTNSNGIEDWRDEFVTAEPVILNEATSTYTPPDTLTGRMSIGFMEDIIRSRNYGPFGATEDEVIQNTVDQLARETEAKLYDTPDIDLLTPWEDEDILNYANTMATIILNHNISDTEGELLIFNEVLSANNFERLDEIEALATMYQNYRDDSLKVPVPAFLAKEHLDLINSYNALHEDIKAMTVVQADPAVTLLRLKRYQDDATGLGYSLQNMYTALEKFAYLITKPEEPATLFAIFSPNFNNQ